MDMTMTARGAIPVGCQFWPDFHRTRNVAVHVHSSLTSLRQQLALLVPLGGLTEKQTQPAVLVVSANLNLGGPSSRRTEDGGRITKRQHKRYVEITLADHYLILNLLRIASANKNRSAAEQDFCVI
jgi:hypothetical protein